MASIRARADTKKLFFDFHYLGKRCREQTMLDGTPANRKKMKQVLDRIEAEITLGQFDYASYFPSSPRAAEFEKQQKRQATVGSPSFSEFADTWLAEMKIQWRESHHDTVEHTLKKHLKPYFGEMRVSCITKADILNFRSSLGKVAGHNGENLSASRVNHIMTPLRMILNEAADRFEFNPAYRGIKSLKVPKTDVQPFTLDEVSLIINSVRADFKNYYTVRFFAGLRTAEVDGLLWKYIDLDRQQILVRETIVRGKMVYTKNDGSQREIHMSQPVFDALKSQFETTGKFPYVFCGRQGTPLSHNNVTKRVWHPLLRYLGLEKRRPYQTRHTAATLWLAAGENPEWIARQMGHTTTEMLFRVYSRYVPNLTRQDGSAFERLLKSHTKSATGGES